MKTTRLFGILLATALLSACGQAPVTSLSQGFDPTFSDEAASGVPGISVYFNDTYKDTIAQNQPAAKKDPRNTDKGVYKLIRAAKSTIDGSLYDIEDLGVTAEFVKAAQRGVKIRFVTDTDNMVEKADPSKPRQAIVQLKAAGVPIVEDHRSAIMHDKFMVVDGKTLWTGSTNLTPTSLYCHNNNAMLIQSPELASQYEGEFERLFTKKEFSASQRGGDAPPNPEVTVGTAHIRAFFSPNGGGRDAVVAELKQATKSIKFLTFSLTDEETGDVMLAKAKAGVKVEGVFDRWLAAGKYSLFDKFKRAGIAVHGDGNEALMHHKIIIIDDKTLITGSYNYSQNAEDNNNEAFLIIHNAPSLVKAYAGEFQRVNYAAWHNHPPAYKKPDAEDPSGNGP